LPPLGEAWTGNADEKFMQRAVARPSWEARKEAEKLKDALFSIFSNYSSVTMRRRGKIQQKTEKAKVQNFKSKEKVSVE
jgi:hypothetical protein